MRFTVLGIESEGDHPYAIARCLALFPMPRPLWILLGLCTASTKARSSVINTLPEAAMYRVANASQYLAITGHCIPDIKIAKKSWVFPWQSCTILDVSPVNYKFNVQAMSAEKLPFILPAVFTIGPNTGEVECLLRYARLLSAHDQHSNHVNELVQGVIEGETRALAASMTVEAIFQGINEFKQQVLDHVQLELNKFGLLIYNANVKQLVDVPGYDYFSYLGQKTQIEAANQARVDEAEARMKGEVIVTRYQGEGQKEQIKVQAEVKIFEIEREAEVAAKKASYIKNAKLAEVEAVKAVALREAELEKEVETMNALLTEPGAEYESRVSYL